MTTAIVKATAHILFNKNVEYGTDTMSYTENYTSTNLLSLT